MRMSYAILPFHPVSVNCLKNLQFDRDNGDPVCFNACCRIPSPKKEET
jgi:hypothetical protein